MHQFIEFVIRHWELWLAFFVLGTLLLGFELHSQFNGTASLTPHKLTLLINRHDATLLDIRDRASFTKGHIVDAIHIPLADLNDRLKSLDNYKNKPIVIIYGQGQAFNKAIALLKANGFSNVNSLQGGINAWQTANLPLVKG